MKGISIIIPAFNREKFIGDAIQSVIDQEYHGNIEIIISDDGSSDKTIEIAESFGDKVTIVKKPKDSKSQGAAGARNRGIKISTQPYICFLDSDDFFLAGHLKKMASSLESQPGLGFAFCRTLEIDEEKSLILFRKWTKGHITCNDISNPAVSGNDVVNTNVFIFQRYVFDKVGVFDETFENGEDSDMWMRISELYRGTFSDHFGAVRRRHGINQLTNNSKESVLSCYCEVYKKAIKRYHKLGLKDTYRLFRLHLLVIKYRLNYLKLFKFFYPIYFDYKIKRKIKYSEWHELSHFVKK